MGAAKLACEGARRGVVLALHVHLRCGGDFLPALLEFVLRVAFRLRPVGVKALGIFEPQLMAVHADGDFQLGKLLLA